MRVEAAEEIECSDAEWLVMLTATETDLWRRLV
jgi:hypothetical protein